MSELDLIAQISPFPGGELPAEVSVEIPDGYFYRRNELGQALWLLREEMAKRGYQITEWEDHNRRVYVVRGRLPEVHIKISSASASGSHNLK